MIAVKEQGLMAGTTTNRPYDAPRRRAQAQATREAVLAAARRLFVDRGIAGTTIAAIARGAGVSPQTVYALFRSKAGVLLALLDELERSVDAAAHAAAIEAAPSPQDQLRLLVAFHCELFDRSLDLIELVRRTSNHPEVRPFWEEGQRRRRGSCARWVARWDEVGALRPGIDPTTASDLLWLHCGDDVYASLVIGCGWKRHEVQDWLVRALVAELFPADPGIDHATG